MNKTAIKNFAVNARITLIEAVKQRAFEYEITENGENDLNLEEIGGRPITPTEKEQRRQLIRRIERNGFARVMEEAAYTWFNRFIALRFMEVNGYLPSRIRVFSDERGSFKPEILTEALNVDIDGLNRDHVLELLDNRNNDELYKYLLITQCNALNVGLPEMFEEIGGQTELLFPNNLLRNDSIIARMVKDIPEEDWTDRVQIIGWLYQYYNSEPKNKVFADLKKNIKISAENIPAATQLFTPDWIVRYMVDNSLGRLWLEGHSDSSIRESLKFYIDGAEQDKYVLPQLKKQFTMYKSIAPEQIKIIDPCMGSGHILVYAFDVLMQIYTSCGRSERDAAMSIITNNLYGLDIDKRAYQLACFAVKMKARQYNRSILKKKIPLNLANFRDISGFEADLLDEPLRSFADRFKNADTYGSLTDVNNIGDIDESISLYSGSFGLDSSGLEMMMKIHEILSRKYDVVVTNPPYMNSSNMNAKLSEFIKNNYTDYKSDLFSAFIVRCTALAKPDGYLGFLTPYVWMFIQSYEKLRKYIYSEKTIETLIQFEYSAFEEATVPICTFVLKNSCVNKKGCYLRLTDFRGGMEVQRGKTLEAISDRSCGFYYEANSDSFSKIPGSPTAYWVSEKILRLFENDSIEKYVLFRQGMATSDNNRFLRCWHEVDKSKMCFDSTDLESAKNSGRKWFPYNKGGNFRKWYGNHEYAVNWENDGMEMKDFTATLPQGMNVRLKSREYYFRSCYSWSKISSGSVAFRYYPDGFAFDVAGCCVFNCGESLYYYLGLSNSIITSALVEILSPTLNYELDHLKKIPVIFDKNKKADIDALVEENISLSKQDWDSFETSWNFKKHPLL